MGDGYDTKFYRVREPSTPLDFAKVVSGENPIELGQWERDGRAWLLDRAETNRGDHRRELIRAAEARGANVLRAYPLPGVYSECIILLKHSERGWKKIPRMPQWVLRKPKENPATDQDKIHNVVLYKTEGVYEARRLANTISDGKTGKLLEAKAQGGLKRTGTTVGPLGNVLKAAKDDGVTLVRAKLVKDETGKDRIKVLYIHPIRGIWQQMKFSALHYRFPSRPFPRKDRQEDTGLRLWLDDMRPAPDGWVWVNSVDKAIELISSEEVVEASLDHDLGDGEQEGYKLVLYMAENDTWPTEAVSVHSSNPPGSERMCGVIERYGSYRRLPGTRRFVK